MQYALEILPSLLKGASLTLQVFAFVLILSIPLGIVVAFLLQLRSKILHGLLTIYIWIMRGTPLLLQLIFIYYVLPSIGIRIDRLLQPSLSIMQPILRKSSVEELSPFRQVSMRRPRS